MSPPVDDRKECRVLKGGKKEKKRNVIRFAVENCPKVARTPSLREKRNAARVRRRERERENRTTSQWKAVAESEILVLCTGRRPGTGKKCFPFGKKKKKRGP